MKVNNNIAAVVTNKQLLGIESELTDSMERLSSGLKLNHSADDPAGVAISYRMQLQIDSLEQATSNVDTATSVVQTIDGALNEITNMLQRMNELAVQAANGTMGEDEKAMCQDEISSLVEEITRIAESTEFNGKTLLDGSINAQVYVDAANKGSVSRLNVSESVATGTYSFSIDSAATQATYDLGLSIDDIVGNDCSITVNGVTATFTSDMTADEVLEELRDRLEYANCELIQDEETGSITISTNTYGAHAALVISQTGETSVFGDEIPNTELDEDAEAAVMAIGEDAQITLGEGFNSNSTVKLDGNHLTITNSQGFEMSMMLAAGYTTESMSLEVTTIGIMDVQVGIHEGQSVGIRVQACTAEALYLDSVNLATIDGATTAITTIDKALSTVNSIRSKVGAFENRLDYAANNLETASENMEEAISRLQDTDMASEMVTYSKYNILQQAATSCLSQANSIPELALQILG